MRFYYISSTEGPGGIAKYSKTFYDHVLSKMGYVFVDSKIDSDIILTTITSKDKVHIEIGIFQKKEIEILLLMLNANYKNVSITLHDPPLLKYPFYEFKNPILLNTSKFYDKYLNGSKKITTALFKKIENIYVLSTGGMDLLKSSYGLKNVHYLPHIVSQLKTANGVSFKKHFLYFGFIGKNKGLEYSLALHEKVNLKYPGTMFYVIGKVVDDRQQKYYEKLKTIYNKNVEYLGYVAENDLDDVFQKASIAILPFSEYSFYQPVSGSILYCMQQAKLVLTNKVNRIPEILEDGKNGIFLKGEIEKDLQKVDELFGTKSRGVEMINEASKRLHLNHSPESVLKYLKT